MDLEYYLYESDACETCKLFGDQCICSNLDKFFNDNAGIMHDFSQDNKEKKPEGKGKDEDEV